MKITKKPSDLGRLSFSCRYCDTEWELDSNEYVATRDVEYKKERGILFSHWTETPSWKIIVHCPHCHSLVVKYIPTGKTRRCSYPYGFEI